MSELHIRGVAFDLDGLIANTEDVYEASCQRIAERRGHEMDPRLREQMMGRPAIVSWQILIDWYQLDETPEALAHESTQVFAELLDTMLAPMPGLHDLLAWLEKNSLPRIVATSGTRAYADDILRRLGITENFLGVLTADDITRGKPEPEVFLLAAQHLGVSPTQMLVLEDTGIGCQAGVAAGAVTVAVPNRHTSDHDFPQVQLRASSLTDPALLSLLTPNSSPA